MSQMGDTLRSHRDRVRNRPKSGLVIISLGVVIMVIEVVLHWIRAAQDMDYGVLFVGSFFCFTGYFVREPNLALNAGAFAVDSTVKLVTSIPSIFVRKGRRVDDPVVRVPIIDESVTPAEFPIPEVKPTSENRHVDHGQ